MQKQATVDIEKNRDKKLLKRKESKILLNQILLALLILTSIIGIYHGNLNLALSSKVGTFQTLGALFGTLLQLTLLVTIILSSRWRYLESKIGLDHMLNYHRIAGELSILFLLLHITSEVIGSKLDLSWQDTLNYLVFKTPYMAMAVVASLLLGTIVLTSIKKVRKKLSYETWYYIHILIYISLILSFYHEIYIGLDFSIDKVAKNFWIGLNILVLTLSILSRYKDSIISIFRPSKITSITKLNNETVEIEIGKKVNKNNSGKFMILRFIDKNLWHEVHPFSISKIKDDKITFTVKELGDGTGIIQKIKKGTRVITEGPYGRIDRDLLGGKKLLLVAGGVGIAPIRSLLAELNEINQPVVIYRARSTEKAPHNEEIRTLTENLKGDYIEIFGKSNQVNQSLLTKEGLIKLVPDIKDREVVICGPEYLINSVYLSSIKNNTPIKSIHFERTWW